MTRRKIDYGIDLGTTNSAIVRIDGGQVRVLKSKDGQMDTTPSCVFFTKKQAIRVGTTAYGQLLQELMEAFRTRDEPGRNVFAEFKRAMGTGTRYRSTNMDCAYTPEELSSEVLKKLRTDVDDEELGAAVITVPARFGQPQIEATLRAAHLAGFVHCELLQEPIAASIAFGMNTKAKDGQWLIFDFGGGTFDVALMRCEEGIFRVVDTGGNNRLGGKDLDTAIADQILLPYLREKYRLEGTFADPKARNALLDAVRPFAEMIKKDFSSKTFVHVDQERTIGEDEGGTELEVDFRVALPEFEAVVKPVLQQAIDLTLALLKVNHLESSNLISINLVGGPTYLPTLRKMLAEQVTPLIDVSVDPMMAVAVGAALFASTRDLPQDLLCRDRGKVQLSLRYPESTVEEEEDLGLRIDRALTPSGFPSQVWVEVRRKDGLWSTGRVPINGDAEILTLHLVAGRSNVFDIRLADAQGQAWPCEPEGFSIIQGFKIPEATLPFSMCFHGVSSDHQRECLIPIPGLEKNTPLPNKGKFTARTQQDLNPGKPGEIRLDIYGTDHPYTRAFPGELQETFRIESKDLPQFLPANSLVEVHVEIDASRLLCVKAFFPAMEEELSWEHGIETAIQSEEEVRRDFRRARASIASLEGMPNRSETLASITTELAKLEREFLVEPGSPDNRARSVDRMVDLWKRLDVLTNQSEWPKARIELDEALDAVSAAQKELGDNKSESSLRELQALVERIRERKDIASARKATSQLWGLRFTILRNFTAYWIQGVAYMDENFSEITWRNPGLARQIIDEAKRHIAGTPQRATVEGYVRKLWDLQPDAEETMMDLVNRRLLKK